MGVFFEPTHATAPHRGDLYGVSAAVGQAPAVTLLCLWAYGDRLGGTILVEGKTQDVSNAAEGDWRIVSVERNQFGYLTRAGIENSNTGLFFEIPVSGGTGKSVPSKPLARPSDVEVDCLVKSEVDRLNQLSEQFLELRKSWGLESSRNGMMSRALRTGDLKRVPVFRTVVVLYSLDGISYEEKPGMTEYVLVGEELASHDSPNVIVQRETVYYKHGETAAGRALEME